MEVWMEEEERKRREVEWEIRQLVLEMDEE
jgi:hypothetical protein